MDEQLTERQMEVASRVKGQADVLSNAVESGHSRGTCHGLALQLVSEGQVLLKMLDASTRPGGDDSEEDPFVVDLMNRRKRIDSLVDMIGDYLIDKEREGIERDQRASAIYDMIRFLSSAGEKLEKRVEALEG